MLIEPEVLVRAKHHLLDESSVEGYAVVDSQFRKEMWGSQQIPSETRAQLEPINSLRLREGEPDAIIAPPQDDFYVGGDGKTAIDLPLGLIEAKGETGSSDQNSTRVAITQAHRHLGEVNVGYAAVPRGHITDQDRVLAREVNVGLLSVSADEVELLETPRLLGVGESQATETIRFHARVGTTAVENLAKNHPKNAVGYALALQGERPPDELFTEFVINSVEDGRRDAESLGLVVQDGGKYRVTPLGREGVRTITYHHEGVIPALESIAGLYGSSKRFIDARPVMAGVARQTLLAYPPTQLLVDTIGEVMADGHTPTLARVARNVARDHPDFAVDLFVATEDRQSVFSGSNGDRIDLDAFYDGGIYSTHTTYQYKAMLYHVGLLTTRGTDTKAQINPTEAVWALETPF